MAGMTKLYDDSASADTGSVGVFGLLGILGPGPDYQSFTSASTVSTLTSISLDLAAPLPNDGGSFTVNLYSNAGTAAGGSLANLGTIQDSSLSATSAFFTLSIAGTVTLAANTTYWIGLSSNNTGALWQNTLIPVGTGTTGQASETSPLGIPVVSTLNQFLMTVDATSLCFAAGARVLTAQGEIPVEALEVGDRVAGLRSGTFRPVRWIGHRNVDLSKHPDPDAINPIRICAGAFGPNRPHRDLILSPNHALYVDGHLIAARYLLNGATVRQETWETIDYYHVELDAHDVMLVDGMAAESFLDVGNRAAFSNGGEPVMLHPDFARKTWDAEACAPDLPKGEELSLLRRRLLDQAQILGHALSRDADISVLVGQSRLSPVESEDGFHFNLPPGVHSLQIMSRVFKPSELRPDGVDDRLLGIGVLAMALDAIPIALDSQRLTAGWHAPEQSVRWTAGAATLRVDGARTLTLQTFREARYWVTEEVVLASVEAA
jgi:hypothetical protein